MNVRRGRGHLFPERKRCLACRGYFGFLVVDGLFDSYACAGRGDPSEVPPEDWPRQHYVPRGEGARKPKRGWLEERKAARAARRQGGTYQHYRCEFCREWHIGRPRKP